MSAKFAIHPDWIVSKTDGDLHWIGIGQLVKLYELKPDEYIVWNWLSTRYGYKEEEYIHLYPKRDGRYGRPIE